MNSYLICKNFDRERVRKGGHVLSFCYVVGTEIGSLPKCYSYSQFAGEETEPWGG